MSRRRLVIFLCMVVGLALCWYLIGGDRSANPAPTDPKSPPPSPSATSGVNAPVATPMNRPTSKGGAVSQFFNAFQSPLTFYGKVVDQHGNPIEQADVLLMANDNPVLGGKTSHYTRKTDKDGCFSITGVVGIGLAVEVSKPDYKAFPGEYKKVTSSGVFEAGDLTGNGPNASSKSNPTVFKLYKPGPMEPLVKIGKTNFRIARDGTPLLISFDRKGEQPMHQMLLRCWTQDIGRPKGQYYYDWRLELNVPGGGLVVRTNPLDFEAPEDGYISNDTIDMTDSGSGKKRWSSTVERSYFIRFSDGTFARVNLEMCALGDHYVIWESFLNPKVGSRNLEAPDK